MPRFFKKNSAPHPQARILATGLLLLGAGSVQAALVINEFLPDPEGADSGREFVELLNTGPGAEVLTGVRLEFANGSEGPVWQLRWQEDQDRVLAPGERFLVVDRNWLGTEDWQAQVSLALQNGPDALRLVRMAAVLDLVGYGTLTDAAMMETSPVPVSVGLSLSRRPDGLDTGDNGADFVSADPTPGGTNFQPYQWSLVTARCDPGALDRPGLPVGIQVTLQQTGTEIVPAGNLELVAFGQRRPVPLDPTPPGLRRSITWILEPATVGRWPLDLAYISADLEDTLSVGLGGYQVGPGFLILNEVLPAPEAGQGEWIEVACPGPEAVLLSGYRLRDQDGSWQVLPEIRLSPGEMAVLAQDRPGLVDWLHANRSAGLPGDCLEQPEGLVVLELPGSWPTLNNSPPTDRTFADRVYLADSTGTVVDLVTLGALGGAGEVISGVSWERMAVRPVNPTQENWTYCTSLAGATCGCPNSVAQAGSAWPVAGLSVEPAVLDVGEGLTSQHFRFQVPPVARGWDVRIFDTWGHLVRDMGGEFLGPGPRDLVWDGRDDEGRPAGTGAYLVLLQLRDSHGQLVATDKALSVVHREF